MLRRVVDLKALSKDGDGGVRLHSPLLPAHKQLEDSLRIIRCPHCLGLGEVLIQGTHPQGGVHPAVVVLFEPLPKGVVRFLDGCHRLRQEHQKPLTPRGFYWGALRQLDCTPSFLRGDAKRQLHQVILDLAENNHKIPVAIIDEAHLLGKEMLEEFRFLLNFHYDSYNPMSLILVGQPELRRVFQLQVYEAISQRLNLRYHLPPMDREEMCDYVAHHLKMAGAVSSIFTDDALEVIFEFSGGIARKVNNICLACLLDASIRQKRLIDDHMVKVVIANEFSVNG